MTRARTGGRADVYPPGHVGIALTLCAPVGVYLYRRGRTRLSVAGTAAVAGLTLLPDVDEYVPWFVHRGPTHTLWFALLVGTAAGALSALVADRRGRSKGEVLVVGASAAGFGALAVLAHLLGDVLTPMGIRPLAPVSDASYTLDVVYSRNPTANAGLLALGAVATVAQLAAATGLEGTPSAPSALGRTVNRVRRAVLDGPRATRPTRPAAPGPSTGRVGCVGRARETDD